ncbi:peptidase [Pyrococcus kukulkanii]|uniref:peptidase n=1 Tax=Pyrococcus kukulkanii TaxID=1609559 RepID=UPI00356726C1
MIENLKLALNLNFNTGSLEGSIEINLRESVKTFILNKGLKVEEANRELSQELKGIQGFEKFKVSVVKLEEPANNLELIYSGKLESYESVLPYLKDSINREYTLLRTDSLFYPIPAEPAFESLVKSVVSSEFNAEIDIGGVPDDLTIAFGGEIRDNRLIIEGTNRLDIAIAPFHVIEGEQFRLFVLSTKGIERTLDLLRRAYEFYSSILGKKTAKYTVIETPENYGGQAGKGYALVSGSSLRREIPANLYHELAHLWNPRVTPEAHLSRFFDEAFANYLTALAIREIHGEEAFNSFIENLRRDYEAVLGRFPEAEKLKPSEWGKLGLSELSYTKGTLILHDLHQKLGEDFYEILRRMVNSAIIDFQRFKEIVEDVSGLVIDI